MGSRRLVWLTVLVCAGFADRVMACLADGVVAVSLNLPQGICEIAPQHVNNAACCSGKASPVWNASTAQCDTTCDSSDPCVFVTCTAIDQCHDVGTCDSATGLCSNPAKGDGTGCSDGNSCTFGDSCTGGSCVSGTPTFACCGNGVVDAGEQCDDGNQSGDPPDGCGANCTVNAFWTCSGQPSACCLSRDAVRFTLPGLNQSQCESVQATPDAGCCSGTHRGVWTGSACNVVCTLDLCKENHVVCQPLGVCYSAGSCDPNTGLCSTPVLPSGAACGTVAGCKEPQCDGFGSCNQLGNAPDGLGCDDGNPCTTSQCQSGQCTTSGQVVCQPSDECHVAGVCNPLTGCSNPPAPASTPCGNVDPLGPCDHGDSCSGDGACLPNSLPDSSFCGDPAGTCISPGLCSSGICLAAFVPLAAGMQCGVTTAQGECDRGDTCDTLGNCLSNAVTDGNPCGSGDPDCFIPGTCTAGSCVGAGTEPPGTACGDTAPLGDCDEGDRCDDTGQCRRNLLDASHVCRSAAGACDVAETCDGTNPVCPANAFVPASTPCGESGACGADQCDAAGHCQPKIDCPATTTTTTVVGGTNTSTTAVPEGEPCADIVGIAHARCLIDVAMAGTLCNGETIPAKLEHTLRARLTMASKQLEAAEKSTGRKSVRQLKKARRALTAMDRKAAAALKAKKSEKQISSACKGEIGGLVSAIDADLS